MKFEPVISEKTMGLAKEGKYTFRVEKSWNKFQIARIVEEQFGVHVTRVWTIKVPGEIKKTYTGRKRVILSGKKAIVTLKEKEKIDLFEETKK